MSVLVAGSVALDDLKTPFGERKMVLGGSAVHASVSVSFFSPVELVGTAGKDFPVKHIDFLDGRGIGLSGLELKEGKTFHWEGFYEYDMNSAHTVKTDLNVLQGFDPELSAIHRKSKYVFLANLDPQIQLKIIDQLENPVIIAADTMNFWIDNKKDELLKLIKKVDVMLLNEMEARQLSQEPNLIKAAGKILKLGCRYVIIKKGEHGALLFSKKLEFSAPSFPQTELIDPTGAGDSFAGGFIGYLAATKGRSDKALKKAVVVGSVMASFNVEDFSLERMKTLKKEEISARYGHIKKCAWFDELEKNLFG
ncbi:MAG: PfkB family carbohydrate kinase [Candidatus Margulisiibacteriota bacterium]